MHKRVVNVNVEKAIKNAFINLSPKVDHLTKEFNRIGVRATQLTTQDLVELFFDIYNPSTTHGQRVKTNVEDYKTALVEPAILEE